MLKLQVFVVFLLAVIIEAGPVVYNEPVLLSSLDPQWHLIPVEPKASNEPNLYGAEQEAAEKESFYDQIYGWTLKPILDLTDWMLSPVMSMYEKTMNFMGFGNKSKKMDDGDDAAPRSRRKRGVVGSVANTAVNTVHLPLSFIYDIALAPFRLIRRIFNFITAPFRAVYNKIGSLILPSSFRNNSQSSNVVLALLSNTGSTTTDNEEMWNQMMKNVGKAAKRNAVKMLNKGWDYTKADILPSLDSLIEKYGESDLLPEDFRKMLKNFRRIYQVTHMFNII
ncbi:Protein of unknown function [Cotesia congregata]|uniref:Uncharacterized protein n=1 Tax=Cotesia congregata TaxID=51543 RepID=A0A8J2H9M6_COTCN|nr:Protein of unknown function [Cotesia congregata]